MGKLDPISFLGDFIDGRFVQSEHSDGEWQILSPADLQDEVSVLSYKNDHVEQACLAAKAAFRPWSRRPLEERKVYIKNQV